MKSSRTIIRSGTEYYIDQGRRLRSAEARRLWGALFRAIARWVVRVVRRRRAARTRRCGV